MGTIRANKNKEFRVSSNETQKGHHNLVAYITKTAVHIEVIYFIRITASFKFRKVLNINNPFGIQVRLESIMPA